MIPVPDFDVDMRGAAIVTPHRPEQLADRIMIVIGIILGHRGSRAIAAVRIGPNPPEQLESVEIVMAVMVGLPQIDDCARYRRAGRGIGNPPRPMKHRRSCRGISSEQIAILSKRRGAIEGTFELGPQSEEQ